MGLKSFYYRQEEKYFKFLDRMESKGINFYKIVDPLEKKGIPTFLIFNLILLLIIIFVVYLLIGFKPTTDQTYTLTFVDIYNEPIPNQTFRVLFDITEKQLETDSLGIAQVIGLKKKEYPIYLNSDTYSLEKPQEIDFKQANNFSIFLKPKINTFSKTIYFEQNGALLTTHLTVSKLFCVDNQNYVKSDLKIIDGSLILDDLPLNCGALNLELESINVYETIPIRDDSLSETVNLQPDTQKIGNAQVKVMDKNLNTLLQGVSVSLINTFGEKVRESETNISGLVSFENIPVDTYYLIIYDNLERYKPITEIDNFKITVLENKSITQDVFLDIASIGKINVKVYDDASKQEIPNVKVSLYKDNLFLKEKFTDATGDVSFGIENDVSYKLVFNHSNYIIKTQTNIKISSVVRQVYLTPITNENYKAVNVTVVDPNKNPVEYATVKLWDDVEKIYIETTTADVYGRAYFYNLDTSKLYKLEAIKGKFKSNLSNPFSVMEQTVIEETVILNIGEGTLSINLLSEYGEALNANIFVYDALFDTLLPDKSTQTNEDGFTMIKIRADKQVYFVIEDLDNSRIISPSYSVDADKINTINLVIPSKLSSASGISFLGFYNSAGERITSVAPGSQVIARFVLNISKKYSRAVAHIRSGATPLPLCGTTSYDVFEDPIYLKEIRFAKSKNIGSTTFTPCLGEQIDLSNEVSKNAKWFNLILENPFEGSYLIEADVVVQEDVFSDQPLNYRAEFYEGARLSRDPVDASYDNQASQKQNLYAQTKQTLLFTGTQSQCNSFLCYNFLITDVSNNLTKNIVDAFPAKLYKNYKLNFSINMLDKKLAPNSSLVISSGASLDLKNYVLNLPNGMVKSGTTDFSNIDIGNLTSNDFLTGNLDLSVVNDVSDVLKFSIISNGQEIFSKDIFFEIKGSKELSLEFVPRKVMPFIPNDFMFYVSDDSNSALSNVNIFVTLNNQPLKNGITNYDGLFGFVSPALDLGDTLTFIASKDDYRTKEISLVIDDELIQVIPEKIDLSFDISQNIIEVYYLSLFNQTISDIKILSITQNTKNDFVKLNFELEEDVLKGLEQTDIGLIATLSDKGKNLYTQQNIQTEIALKLHSHEMNKTWLLVVPVSLRLTLGNALDSLDCLKITPLNSLIKTKPNEEVVLNLTLENQCSTRNLNVDLGNIYAMLDWQSEKEAGVFSIISSSKEFILEDLKESVILTHLAKNSKQNLQLKFKAFKVNSDHKTPALYFMTRKGNFNGVDEVVVRFPLEIFVNNYAECIELPKQPISALACNWFGGYNYYSQYYGGSNYYSPHNANNYFNPYNSYQSNWGYYTQQQNPTQGYNYYAGNYVGAQNSIYNPYNYNQYPQFQNPFSNYNNFMQNYGGNMNFTNGMQCPATPFVIKNNCSEPVDIKLDNTYGLSVISDKEFSLDVGEFKESFVLGGESMGYFNIPVSTKPSIVSNPKYTLLDNIPVSVNLPISFMPSKCITVAPQKLDFSNILKTKHQIVKVYNTCVAEGYNIVELNYLDLEDLNFNGVSFLSVGSLEGRITPIKVDYDVDLTTNKPIQVWEVALRRNPEIENENSIFVKEYLEKYSKYSVVGNLISAFRKIAINIEDTVNLKFVLQVGLQPPQGYGSIIYENVGMQLTDNFQWLILDTKENWDIINNQTIKDIQDEEEVYENTMFIDFSTQLDYERDSSNNIVFIKVPRQALSSDKFKIIDQDTTSKLCFYGNINDFPLNFRGESIFTKKEGKFYLKDVYKPLSVSIEFITPKIFKLCFERPVDSISNNLVKNNVLSLRDVFKESLNSDINKQFSIYYLDENNKNKPLGDLAIGVITDIDARKVGEAPIDPADEPSKPGDPGKPTTPDVSQLEFNCISPDLSIENYGLTGNDAFKQFGFDLLHLNPKVDDKTCFEKYCDEDQFYEFLQKYVSLLENVISIDGVNFVKENTGIKRANITFNYCALCNDFNYEKETLKDYISELEKIFNGINKDLKKLVVIKSKGFGDNSANVKTLGDYNYTTLNYFLDKYDSLIYNNVDFYNNLEVFVGQSNTLVVKLKEFTSNAEVLNNFNNIFISKPIIFNATLRPNEIGEYLVTISTEDDGANKKINIDTIKLENKLNLNSYKYNKNLLLKTKINPIYLMSQNMLHSPFYINNLVNGYIKNNDYSKNKTQLQSGYIYNLNNNNLKYAGEFIDSRPFYFSSNNDYYIFSEAQPKTSLQIIENNNKLFLLHGNNNGYYLETKDKLSDYLQVFTSKDSSSYNMLVDKLNPNIKYESMYDVFNQIKNGNVCFRATEDELLLWHNPSKFNKKNN